MLQNCLQLWVNYKGQLIPKRLFAILKFFQKTNKTITYIIDKKNPSFVFWKNCRLEKKNYEFVWPLGISMNIKWIFEYFTLILWTFFFLQVWEKLGENNLDFFKKLNDDCENVEISLQIADMTKMHQSVNQIKRDCMKPQYFTTVCVQ